MRPSKGTTRMIGVRQGRLTIVGKIDRRYKVRCDCGVEKEIDARNLYRTESCGCLKVEVAGQHAITHGLMRDGKRPPEFLVWCNMRRRCSEPSNIAYHSYGGRGIAVCDRWLDFGHFYADMGPRPSSQHSIERINNNGNYEPGNCRWATRREQGANKRNNAHLEVGDETLILAEAARRGSISATTLHCRIKRGWSADDAVSAPPVPRPRLLLTSGERFGALTLVGPAPRRFASAHDCYELRCDCGGTVVDKGTRLVSGRRRSQWCGRMCPLRRAFYAKQRAEKKAQKPVRICAECNRPACALGLCNTHYRRTERARKSGREAEIEAVKVLGRKSK
jgi:hypothetical protein